MLSADPIEYSFGDGAEPILSTCFNKLSCRDPERPGWANARDAIRMFKEVERQREVRISKRGKEEKPTFTASDAQKAAEVFLKSRPQKSAENNIALNQSEDPPDPPTQERDAQHSNVRREVAEASSSRNPGNRSVDADTADDANDIDPDSEESVEFDEDMKEIINALNDTLGMANLKRELLKYSNNEFSEDQNKRMQAQRFFDGLVRNMSKKIESLPGEDDKERARNALNDLIERQKKAMKDWEDDLERIRKLKAEARRRALEEARRRHRAYKKPVIYLKGFPQGSDVSISVAGGPSSYDVVYPQFTLVAPTKHPAHNPGGVWQCTIGSNDIIHCNKRAMRYLFWESKDAKFEPLRVIAGVQVSSAHVVEFLERALDVVLPEMQDIVTDFITFWMMDLTKVNTTNIAFCSPSYDVAVAPHANANQVRIMMLAAPAHCNDSSFQIWTPDMAIPHISCGKVSKNVPNVIEWGGCYLDSLPEWCLNF